MPFSSNLLTYLVRLIVLFSILPVHECAHGWMANKLGDPTAKNQGRLNLNPFTHLDLLGSVCMLLAGVGWAKPVPINPFYFKNRKLGMALTALAGPVSNLVLGFLLLVIGYLILGIATVVSGGMGYAVSLLFSVLTLIARISVSLAVFNLLPVPPLDGSRILNLVLPERLYFQVMRYERYIMIGLMVLLYVGVLNVPLNFLTSAVFGLLNQGAQLVLIPFGGM